MNIAYQWKIIQLERRPSDGAVIVAHWDCVGTDSETGLTGRSYGASHFEADSELPGFIPFEDLTEEQVLTWIWSRENNKEPIEQTIASIIDEQINPPTVPGLPW